MPEDLLLDFLSKSCKANIHSVCAGRWQGIGLEVYCSCECHGKQEKVLNLVAGPVANTLQKAPSSVAGEFLK